MAVKVAAYVAASRTSCDRLVVNLDYSCVTASLVAFEIFFRRESVSTGWQDQGLNLGSQHGSVHMSSCLVAFETPKTSVLL